MKPVQIFAEREYICLCDRKEKAEDQTIFVLGTLTVEQEAYLDDMIQREDGGMDYGSNILRVLHFGLKKVKNFKENGVLIKFERDEDALEMVGGVQPWKSNCLQKIPIKERREIAAEIRRGMEIQETEAKN